MNITTMTCPATREGGSFCLIDGAAAAMLVRSSVTHAANEAKKLTIITQRAQLLAFLQRQR